jgi:hypothetical protein
MSHRQLRVRVHGGLERSTGIAVPTTTTITTTGDRGRGDCRKIFQAITLPGYLKVFMKRRAKITRKR